MEITIDDINLYLQNIVTSVEGEKSILEKIDNELFHSKIWFNENIADLSLVVSDESLRLAKGIIIYHAFRIAIPSLDLVLTTNGFGVVSNQNIAPASKERVEALRRSLLIKRDEWVDALWNILKKDPQFGSSQLGKKLKRSLFQDLSLSILLGEEKKSLDTFILYMMQIIQEENFLSVNIISAPLMEAMRKGLWEDNLTDDLSELCSLTKDHIVKVIKEQASWEDFATTAVEFIRTHDSLFNIWKDTHTAEIFEDYSFINRKELGGIWL